MLDVHAPHETVHSWKDFFIHIATIVIGLLIAVGLEQTVEWLHHKSEIRETRQLLAEERTQNVDIFHNRVRINRVATAWLQNDLRVFLYLQQHPGTPPDKLPGVPVWGFVEIPYVQGAWVSAEQANVVALMPQREVQDSRDLYHWLNEDDEKQSALVDAFNKARAYAYIQPDPSKLTRAQVDAEIPLIQDCLRLINEGMQGLSEIASVHADFSPGPSNADRLALQREISLHPDKDFPAAFAFLRHDLDNARALMRADQPALEFAQETSERGAGHLPDVYEQIHAKYPDFKPNENTVNGFGYIAMGKGDLPGAINVFKFNVKLYPDSWDVYDSLGEAYAKAGKKKLAIENYQHAHQLNPTAPSPIEALKKLQK